MRYDYCPSCVTMWKFDEKIVEHIPLKVSRATRMDIKGHTPGTEKPTRERVRKPFRPPRVTEPKA